MLKAEEAKEDKFVDESGDRKYFTQIPNIIIDTLNCKEMALYIHIKRKAGDKGIFSQGKERSAEQLGISAKTHRKYLKSLINKGFIKFDGTRRYGQNRSVDVYRITDIWLENTEFYTKKNK